MAESFGQNQAADARVNRDTNCADTFPYCTQQEQLISNASPLVML